ADAAFVEDTPEDRLDLGPPAAVHCREVPKRRAIAASGQPGERRRWQALSWQITQPPLGDGDIKRSPAIVHAGHPAMSAECCLRVRPLKKSVGARFRETATRCAPFSGFLAAAREVSDPLISLRADFFSGLAWWRPFASRQ